MLSISSSTMAVKKLFFLFFIIIYMANVAAKYIQEEVAQDDSEKPEGGSIYVTQNPYDDENIAYNGSVFHTTEMVWFRDGVKPRKKSNIGISWLEFVKAII